MIATFQWLFLNLTLDNTKLQLLILTSERAVLNLITFVPIMIFFSVKTSDSGYSLLLIIVMVGQVMFVHVYADNYTIATLSEKEKKSEKVQLHYSHYWNKA